MRTKFLTLVALLLAGAAQADVVIENAGGSGGSTGNLFRIYWTQTATSAKLTSLKLFGGTAASTATFDLYRSGVGVGTNSISGTNNFEFYGDIANAELSAGNYMLLINNLSGSYDYNANASATFANAAYGFSSATQDPISGTQYLTYQLSAAVPEPGTMLLGGIAAACGGVGTWWKRRKRRKQPLLLAENLAIN